MAWLYITECDQLGVDNHGKVVMAPAMPTGLPDYRIAIGMSSGQSDPFSGFTNFVMVNCDAVCSLAFGDNPTADPSAHRLAANETRFYPVKPGQLLAVIANT